MATHKKITIVLRDSSNHVENNRRIIEYLNDRYRILNDNRYTIAIEILDDSNIDDFIKIGVDEVPAIQLDKAGSFTSGVNNILAALAKLELAPAELQQKRPAHSHSRETVVAHSQDEESPFHQLLKEELLHSKEDESLNAESMDKKLRSNTSEEQMSDKTIAEKMAAFERINNRRNKLNSQTQKNAPQSNVGPNKPETMADGDFDADEQLYMRQITGR